MPRGAPNHIPRTQCIAPGGRLLDQLALDDRQDDLTGMIMHTGFSARIPTIVENLDIDGLREVAHDLLQHDVDTHLR
jgi:hypothetical protein